MNLHVQKLQNEIAPLRLQLTVHPVYAAINTIDDLKIFMEHHVYAVWDFMSLLKSLQRQLTCVSVPWIPVGSANTRYLINEIVTGEESDVDHEGIRTSHFELYVKAMEQIGCNTIPIKTFVNQIKNGQSVYGCLNGADIPNASVEFVTNTFSVIENGQTHALAAVFTFGREDLIPGMFVSFVNSLNTRSQKVDILRYYLERHIEVDGGHHANLAYEMTTELCGADDQKWSDATIEAEKALQSRVKLWDAILERIKSNALSAGPR